MVTDRDNAHVIRVADWRWSSFHRFVRDGTYPPDWADGAAFADGHALGE